MVFVVWLLFFMLGIITSLLVLGNLIFVTYSVVRVGDLVRRNVVPVELTDVSCLFGIVDVTKSGWRDDEVFGVEDGDVFVVGVEFAHWFVSFHAFYSIKT